MTDAAHMVDAHTCPAHGGGPLVPAAPLPILVTSLTAARLADFATCLGPTDVLFEGKSMVLAGGLPMSGVGHKTAHSGVIVSGAPSVQIGGPTFALPPNVNVEGNAAYQNKVIRDLYLLSTTPTGRELLAKLGASGQPVTIKEYHGTNGYCTPNSGSDATNGKPTGSIIQYNPDYRSNAYDSSGNLLAQPGQVILGHEMTHALANAEGRQAQGVDSNPPASEPRIEGEEAQAIGTGSHSGDVPPPRPNENSLRKDLGLPRRDNHFGTGGPAAGEPAPINLRPGGY